MLCMFVAHALLVLLLGGHHHAEWALVVAHALLVLLLGGNHAEWALRQSVDLPGGTTPFGRDPEK